MTQSPENLWENQDSNNKISQNHDQLKALYRKKVDAYVESQKKWNPNIFGEKINTAEQFEKFKKFLDTTWDRVLFSEEFLKSDFSKNTLKTGITAYVTVRQNLFFSLGKTLNRQFDFSFDNSILPHLQNEYKKLQNGDLKELSGYASQREKFIVSLFKNKPDVLEKILISQENDDVLLKSIFGNIPAIVKGNEDLLLSIKKLEQAHEVHFDDIKNIIGAFWDNIYAKKSFIEYYIPHISLQDALDLKLLSQDEVEAKIENIFKQTFKKENTIISENEKKQYLSLIDFSSIFIATNSLNNEQLDKIFEEKNHEKLFSKIAKEINSLQKNLRESWELSFESFQDFQKQVQLSTHISPEIKKEIAKLQKDSYMNLMKKSSDGKEQSHYFYLKEATNNLEFVNISRDWGKITKNNVWESDVQTFEEFFNYLLQLSKNKDNYSLEIYNPLEFKAHTKNKAVDEVAISSDIETFEELEKFMNEIDPEYKWSNKQFVMLCKPSDNQEEETTPKMFHEQLFFVDKIENNEVHVRWQDPMSLQDFANGFAYMKTKRQELLPTSNDFFNALKKHENYAENLKDFELKENKIVPKDFSWEKKIPKIEYFIGSNNQAVKILKLNDGTIDFVEWEFKESKDKTKSSKFKGKINGKGISYNAFYHYMSQKNLKPYTKHLEVISEDSTNKNNFKAKKWFFGSWMWLLSLTEIMAWWKMYISAIEDYLKTWNQLKSAKFALSMWKFLPDDVKSVLVNMVEGESKKIMEETMSKLKGKNTSDMIDAIEKILFSSKPYDPKLEAALMTTISKFHFLYPKWLAKYKGQFLWYQALGWKVWDATYLEYKAQCEADSKAPGSNPIPFTEEFLIEELLKKQVSAWKRRNKFDKDYWKYRGQWLSEELEDGSNKTSDFATLDGRLGYCIWEFKNLTYANWIGWMENVWAKWPDPWYLMNTLPFVILASWMSMDFTQPLVNKVKSYGYITAFSSLALISNQDKIKKYNKYVTRVTELMGNPNMTKDFKAIDAKSSQSEKITATYKFWMKYWSELYPKINMNDGLVLSQKDVEGNEILKWYYDTIKWSVHDTDDFKNGMKKDDIEGWFIDIDNNPIAATGAWFDKIGFVDGWKYNSKVSYKYLKMHLDYFKNVILDEDIPIEKRKEIFFDIYQKIERHIFSEISWFINRWGPEWYKSYTCVIDSRKWWIEIFPEKFTTENETFKQEIYDQKLEQKWQQFLNWDLFEDDDVDSNVWQTKKSINEILTA